MTIKTEVEVDYRIWYNTSVYKRVAIAQTVRGTVCNASVRMIVISAGIDSS